MPYPAAHGPNADHCVAHCHDCDGSLGATIQRPTDVGCHRQRNHTAKQHNVVNQFGASWVHNRKTLQAIIFILKIRCELDKIVVLNERMTFFLYESLLQKCHVVSG